MSTASDNAKHFPNDKLWQEHCAKVAAYLEAVSKPPITSKPGWDGRKS